MFEPKIKLSKRVFDKVRIAAKMSGSASVEEFVESLLEKEADRIMTSGSNSSLSSQEADEIANSMKGLGYLE